MSIFLNRCHCASWGCHHRIDSSKSGDDHIGNYFNRNSTCGKYQATEELFGATKKCKVIDVKSHNGRWQSQWTNQRGVWKVRDVLGTSSEKWKTNSWQCQCKFIVQWWTNDSVMLYVRQVLKLYLLVKGRYWTSKRGAAECLWGSLSGPFGIFI